MAASGALTRHRLRSFLITGVVLLLMASAIRQVLPEESDVNALTWILIAAMLYSVVATAILARRMPADRRAFIALGSGLTPALYGFAGVLGGSPPLLMWGGILLSLAFVAVTLATTQGLGGSEPP